MKGGYFETFTRQGYKCVKLRHGSLKRLQGNWIAVPHRVQQGTPGIPQLRIRTLPVAVQVPPGLPKAANLHFGKASGTEPRVHSFPPGGSQQGVSMAARPPAAVAQPISHFPAAPRLSRSDEVFMKSGITKSPVWQYNQMR